MNFKDLNKELNEMDFESTAGLKRIDKMIETNPDTMRRRIMRELGATPDEISGWRAAERRGISFEAYLMSLIQRMNSEK